MSNRKSVEAPTSLALIDIALPIRNLVIDRKPLPLAKQIMNAANDEKRTELLTRAVCANAEALKIGVITDTRSNLNMRNIAAIDASDDNEHLRQALIALEESDPSGCQAVISSLSAATILSLAQPETKLAALIVENTTSKRLASMANSIAGRVYISERRQREADRKRNFMGTDEQVPKISDDPELSHFRQKGIRRQLGQFFDLVKETGDESFEKFALAIAKYQPEPDEPSSALFDAICQLAFEDGRESAIDLIGVLPETPQLTRLKIKLGLGE